MSYKTILVHVTADAAGQRAIGLADAVAQMFEASILGVAAEGMDMAVFGEISGELIAAEQTRIDADLKDALTRFRTHMRDEPRAALCISSLDFPLDALTRHSRGADLIVAARAARHAEASEHVDLPGLLMQSGVPLLLAPDTAAQLKAEHIVVAWREGREAVRAIGDALPFLMRAHSVHLVSVCAPDAHEPVEAGLDEVKQRLARHGVAVQTENLTHDGGDLAQLEAAAERHGADLIVAGAYGRSRLSEWALGGVTQDMLTACNTFLLLSR